jgi:F0F1-type ATP synthase membrane subunit b/b'
MKQLNVILLVFALAGWATFSACDSNPRTNDTQEVTEAPEIENQGDDLESEYDEERADLRQDVQEAQQRIAARIEQLRAEQKTASMEAKVEINRRIERLEEAQLQLSADLNRMGRDLGDGWETFKMKTRRTLEDVEEEFDSNNDGE